MNAAADTACAAWRLLGFALLAALLFALGGCGGGTEEDLPCGWDFVGPLQPGQVAPGCETAAAPASQQSLPTPGVGCSTRLETCT